MGKTLIKMGKQLHHDMKTEEGAAAAFKASALGSGRHIVWPIEERRRRDQVTPSLPPAPPPLCPLLTPLPTPHSLSSHPHLHTLPLLHKVLDHIEAEIFGAGRGNYDRCHLLLAGLLERPALEVPPPPLVGAPHRALTTTCHVTCHTMLRASPHHTSPWPMWQRLLNKKTRDSAKGINAMRLSLSKARDTLGPLGCRHHQCHRRLHHPPGLHHVSSHPNAYLHTISRPPPTICCVDVW